MWPSPSSSGIQGALPGVSKSQLDAVISSLRWRGQTTRVTCDIKQRDQDKEENKGPGGNGGVQGREGAATPRHLP